MAWQQLSCPCCHTAFDAVEGQGAAPARCPACGQEVHAGQAPFDRWYYTWQGQDVGPLTRDQFRALAATGHVHADDLVWHDGNARRVPACEVPGLGVAPPPQAPRRHLLLPLAAGATAVGILTV